VVYSDEVWCGIEYQVASHLIYEGFVEEGLAVVKGVRDRHDGTRRNPWNEFECGSHYARSMASYSLLLALSGFHYSAPAKRISFAPRIREENFACFFSVDSGWGVYRQQILPSFRPIRAYIIKGAETPTQSHYAPPGAGISVAMIQMHSGDLVLQEFGLPFSMEKVDVYLEGRSISAEVDRSGTGMILRFVEPVHISAGETLTILSV